MSDTANQTNPAGEPADDLADRAVYIGQWAALRPDHPAVVVGDGEIVLTYRQLDERSNQVAHALRSLGAGAGSSIGYLLDNDEHVLEVWWGGMRSGVHITPINFHLTAPEVDYIVRDSGVRVLFFSSRLAGVVARALAERPDVALVSVGVTAPDESSASPVPGQLDYETLLAAQPVAPVDPEIAGGVMFYSSGTTGYPKGIKAALSGGGPDDGTSLMKYCATHYRLRRGAVLLSPGPLYHAAPVAWTAAMQTVGGTSVIARRFDAEQTLAMIQNQRVTHLQLVPTMIKRILDLPAETLARFDLSSLEMIWHAAAPCPIPLKQRAIEYFGPIIWEYYSGSEGGGTMISSAEWLERPGSVGRHWSGGTVRVLDPTTHEELPAGEAGLIYFEPISVHRFAYHNDQAKTDEAFHNGLFTLGDIGYLDADGYVFLTDRKSNTINSGGVNIYPQEIENVLSEHPKVHDVAVFGIPHEEMGEQVIAVIELTDGVAGSEALKAEFTEFCRQSLAGYKVPRRIEFEASLPRDANGKLYKRRLRDPYWVGHASKVI
ncbi:AMP-binding protein [Desertimonas flava]|uniref:AMP-binding protein n=1 Tax=Desertimonas flava TaxID=2064846 RepID=UPI00196927AB|nr:AMP-binding protein [Desertimonas flava]